MGADHGICGTPGAPEGGALPRHLQGGRRPVPVAGTFSTEKRALAVAEEAERHAAEVAGGAAGGLDPGTRATRTIKEYAPLFLRHHQVEGNTKDTYADTLRLHVIRSSAAAD